MSSGSCVERNVTPFLWMFRYRFRLTGFISARTSLKSRVQVHDPAEFGLLVDRAQAAGHGSAARLRRSPVPRPAVTGSIRTNTAPQDFASARRAASAASNASTDSATGP